MLWSGDSIAQAIHSSKTRKCIFLVYVFGEDELSQKMDETLAHEAVSNLCKDFVAVKIKSPSDICKQFSQIYPVVVVPSIFFIGLNGQPLEITPGSLNPEDLIKKVKEVIKTHESQVSRAVEVDKTGEAAAAASPAAAASSAATSAAGVSEAMEVEADDVTVTPGTSASLDQRVAYAQQKIQENQETKVVNEEKKEKEKEISRRQLGKDVQKLRRNQVDQSLKEMQDEIKKEREEDRRARQRVKDEIDRDRAQRKAKYEKEKLEREMLQKEMREKKEKENQMTAAEKEAARREFSRIQFRLPNGTSITQQFKSSEPLSAARNFISQHAGSNIQLYTMFPKRTFTTQDMNCSLLSLDLVPSSVILVIPQQSNIVQKASNSSGIFSMILAPVFALLNFLYGIVFGSPTDASSTPDNTTNRKERETPVPSTSTPQRPSTAYKRHSPTTSTSISRQEGNIHKFTGAQDDDDDQSTWNGNSTQQM